MAIGALSGINTISAPNIGLSKIDNGDEKTQSFGSFLKEAVDKVNSLQLESEKVNSDFASGKTDNIHQVTIAADKADIALQFAMQIRTKIMDAYSEIMRIAV